MKRRPDDEMMCWWPNQTTELPDCPNPAAFFVHGFPSLGVKGSSLNAGLLVCAKHRRVAEQLRDHLAAEDSTPLHVGAQPKEAA